MKHVGGGYWCGTANNVAVRGGGLWERGSSLSGLLLMQFCWYFCSAEAIGGRKKRVAKKGFLWFV